MSKGKTGIYLVVHRSIAACAELGAMINPRGPEQLMPKNSSGSHHTLAKPSPEGST
jgi:hypothetical protein